MPIARWCPSRIRRPRGAILLAKPAEPPVGSRGAREAVSAAEARPFGVWPLAPPYFGASARFEPPTNGQTLY